MVHGLYMSSIWIYICTLIDICQVAGLAFDTSMGETKAGGSQFKTSLGYIVTSDNLASQQ